MEVMKCSRCERSSNTVTVTCDKCQLLLCSDCLPIGANQCNECSEEAEKGPGGGAPPISELNSVLAQLLLSTEFHGIISNIVKMAIQDDRALSEAQGEKSPHHLRPTGITDPHPYIGIVAPFPRLRHLVTPVNLSRSASQVTTRTNLTTPVAGTMTLFSGTM